MPAPRPFIGLNDLLLIGKLLDEVTDEDLMQRGFTPNERVRAEALFDDISDYLIEQIGFEWNDEDVE